MRRALVLTAVFGAFLAGLGCNHIAGKCDCTNNPDDAILPVPSQPYPAIGQPAPATIPAPVPATMPPGR